MGRLSTPMGPHHIAAGTADSTSRASKVTLAEATSQTYHSNHSAVAGCAVRDGATLNDPMHISYH